MPRFIVAALYALVGFTFLPGADLIWHALRERRRTLPVVYHERRRRRI